MKKLLFTAIAIAAALQQQAQVTNAQNGLSLFNPTTVELGGSVGNAPQIAASALLVDRELPLNGNSMTWSGTGFFNISSGIMPPPPSLPANAKINFLSDERPTALFCRTDGSSNPLIAASNAAYFENLTHNNYDNAGIISRSIGGRNATAGNFEAITDLSAGYGSSTGLSSIARGGTYPAGGRFEAHHDTAHSSLTDETYGLIADADGGTKKAYGVFGGVRGPAPYKYGVFGTASDNFNVPGAATYGLYGQAVEVIPTGSHYVPGTTTFGMYGRANFGENNIGIMGEINTGTGLNGYGVIGSVVYAGNASGPYTNVFGGYFSGNYLSATAPVVNVGVYSRCPINPGTPPTGNYAGYFDGDVFINGTGSSPSGIFTTSDRTIKKDIKAISNASDILSQIKPKTYHLDSKNVPQLKMDEKRLQYGVIAQELEEILPDLVKEVAVISDFDNDRKPLHDLKTLKSVNYTGLIPILVAGFNEQKAALEQQQQLVADLNKKIDALQKLIENQNNPDVKTANGSISNPAINVVVSDKAANNLDQNRPNPFGESTTISFNITSGFKTAQISFSTEDGKVIKTIDIKTPGQGSINVLASDLTAGLYSYSLIIDGRITDTKKMIRTQ